MGQYADLALRGLQGRYQAKAKQHCTEPKHTGNAVAEQQQAGQHWPQDTADIVGGHVIRNCRAHALGTHCNTYHHAAHRVIGGPADAVDKGCHPQMPNRQRIKACQNRKQQSANRGAGDHQHQHAAQRKAVSRAADEGTKQAHGQQAQHAQHGHHKGRLRHPVGKQGGRQHLQPAHSGGDKTHHEQAPEVRAGKHRGAHARLPPSAASVAVGCQV